MRLCRLLGLRASGSEEVVRLGPRRTHAEITTARNDAVAMNLGAMINGSENLDCGTRAPTQLHQYRSVRDAPACERTPTTVLSAQWLAT